MKHYLFIAFLCASLLGFSQNPTRTFESVDFKNNVLEIKVNDGTYKITPYSKSIVETTFIPSGESFNANSHAVVLKPESLPSELIKTDTSFELKTEGISVQIQKQPFQISYIYKGKPIISEELGYVKNDSLETIQFNLTNDEILYGGGARALGMNRRGYRLELYNRAHYGYETHSELMNYSMPIVMSSNKYMVHFDNAPIGFLDLDSKKDNTLTYETISGRKTYQVVVGDSWTELIDNYTDLTGKQPMPPRWALGNFSSRFGYHSQKEVKQTVQKFRDEQIPLDAIIIDIFWFGKDIQGHMGNLEFLKDSFPNPTQMIKDLKSDNVNTILVTEPFVLTTSKRWQEAVDNDVLAKDSIGNPFTFDFYFGNTGLIDIYNPKGKTWFWNIYKGLADMGVTGIWGDLGEPEVHPSKLLHATGTANEVHNIYGHDWAGLIAEGYKTDFSNQRPFILMRAGSSGSQRYGMIPWSGDVNRTWGGLQSQPEIALQMGMQGLGYMHSDLGGFAGNVQDPELYTRWLQYGVFQPIYRPHAQEDVPAEPIFWDDKTKALAKKSIELRYKLLPYNYNLSFQNHKEGTPLMRPLFFEDDSDPLAIVASTYFWGADFLIAPILIPNSTDKEIYFPKNNNWFDFYTLKKFEGGQTVSVKVVEGHIPTFVRGGALIPMAKPMQSTKEYYGNTFELHYYYDASVKESKGQLYNDDGLTAEAFEKGNYELLKFESEVGKKKIELEFDAEIGNRFQSQIKKVDLIIHNVKSKPKSVKIKRKKINFTYNEALTTVSIPFDWSTSEELEININLN
ncbi:alpha-glucosidase/oligosaccharide 4-alpha-D-glucosyltransferase [Gelidibacter algens]|uniref:Alpha-glucosidase/oligosaccharide 4-alpha-D-glucosyltransferase n=1 Tax=Gelidibacter algens TaxID=49280 RepID=A0A1A7R4I1_9FLAO|nr:TIM-barrel domain-containing protein [Gelidibacter algens]OBX26761.1 glycosyl hydrolase [Gelidibacter algens]RAJ22794.1 alpha-glucosidase/oligosaccharide 4-alpha-D-glucosyltransferase [Gelidibacter algens]